MRTNAMLHFDLSHLAPDQPFTLHAGVQRCAVQPHTRQTLTRARRDNAALRLIDDRRVTHYAQPAALPGNAPLLLRVTAPKRHDDLLDRLVLTSLYLPRKHRASAVRRQRRRQRGTPLPSHPKLAALGADPGVLPSDDTYIDLGDMNAAMDCAAALVFHHGELMTLNGEPASDIVNNFILYAAGINALATSIYNQGRDNDGHPTAHENWVSSTPGTDWTTGAADPGHPIYVWSDQTLEYLALPLRDTLKQTKDEPDLEDQCWTVLPGVTQVPLPVVPAAAADAEATYTVTPVTPQGGVAQTFAFDPATGHATVSLSNTLLRWLQVTVDQYGPGGERIGATEYLNMLSPPDTVMGIPLPTGPTDFTFTFADGASRAVVTLGSLGQGPFDWTYDRYGVGLTVVFNYAIPTTFVALGIAVDQAGWSAVVKDVVPKVVSIVEAAAEGPLATAMAGDVDFHSVLMAVTNLAGSLLLAAVSGSDELKAYLGFVAGESAADAAEPFLGWAALAIGAAADVASMVETTVAVAGNPALMTLQIDRVVDVTVTVQGDPKHQQQWPATATGYTISITYTDGPVYAFDSAFDPRSHGPNPVTHTFTGLPAGGSFTVLASFWAKTGWIAGSGRSTSQTISRDVSEIDVPEFAIVENLVPLTATTTYTFAEKLTYARSARVWTEPPAAAPPTATVSSIDGANVGPVIGALGQITLNERLSALGYSWQAASQGIPLVGTGTTPYTGQEHTFQIIDDAGAAESGLAFCEYAYAAPAGIAFPPPTMPNPPADGFLLEPTTTSSMQLRALPLVAGTPLVPTPGMSFGRFEGLQDDVVVHPAGYAVALSTTTCKLQVVRLGAAAVAEAVAPQAAIVAGEGSRPGLLTSPAAVACSLDRIVVLQTPPDAAQGAVAAFDIKGNPVYCFAGSSSTAPLRAEGNATVRVVDLAVESKNYLYVLKYLAPRTGPVTAADYRLDIHNPDGSFLTQISGLAAARLHVDLWRNLFTLDYEIVVGSGRTEPSVSQWIPSTPGAGGATRPRPIVRRGGRR